MLILSLVCTPFKNCQIKFLRPMHRRGPKVLCTHDFFLYCPVHLYPNYLMIGKFKTEGVLCFSFVGVWKLLNFWGKLHAWYSNRKCCTFLQPRPVNFPLEFSLFFGNLFSSSVNEPGKMISSLSCYLLLHLIWVRSLVLCHVIYFAFSHNRNYLFVSNYKMIWLLYIRCSYYLSNI